MDIKDISTKDLKEWIDNAEKWLSVDHGGYNDNHDSFYRASTLTTPPDESIYIKVKREVIEDDIKKARKEITRRIKNGTRRTTTRI